MALAPGTVVVNGGMENNGATVRIKGNEILQINGTLPNTDSCYVQTGSGAVLEIESGGKLVGGPTKWVSINNGALRTTYNANLADTVAAQKATIDARLSISGGTVTICFGAGVHHYGTLFVTGDVDFLAGNYHPYVDGKMNGLSDLWKSDGSFQVSRLSGATDLWVTSSTETPVANATWSLIKGASGYTGTFTTTFLRYNTDLPAKYFTLAVAGDPDDTLNVSTGP